MQVTKCLRCKGAASLETNGVMVDDKCLVSAKCTGYDCGGEQRHKFVIDDTTCDECESTKLMQINNFEFTLGDESTENTLKQKVKCMNDKCNHTWTSTYTEQAVNLC